jgi:hypothetical protein
VEHVIGDDAVVGHERPQSECERDDGASDEVRGWRRQRRGVAVGEWPGGDLLDEHVLHCSMCFLPSLV